MQGEIYVIELNLDDDFANICAYHVDSLRKIFFRNIENATRKQKPDRWVLVGFADSLDEALESCEELRRILCK